MTETPRIEQAVEALAKKLYDNDDYWPSLGLAQDYWRIRVRSLLALPAPDGLPWLVVRAEEK